MPTLWPAPRRASLIITLMLVSSSIMRTRAIVLSPGFEQCCVSNWKRQCESAASAHDTCGSNFPSMRPGNCPRYGEAQSRTAPRSAGNLYESVEYLLKVVLRYPVAFIRNRYLDSLCGSRRPYMD